MSSWPGIVFLVLSAVAVVQTPDEREVYENAARVLTADVEADPENAEAWFGLSIAYMHLGQLEQALDATRRAAELDGQDPRYRDQLGEAHLALGRLSEAITAFEQAAALNPRLFFPRLRLGALYLETGRVVSAIEHLEEAIVLSGRDPEARRLLGLAYATDGQLERALEEYERALFLAPDNEATYLETAEVFFTASMEVEAETILSQAVERFPRSAEARLGLARLHVEAGRLREALNAFETALALGDDRSDLPLQTIYKTMGDIHFDLIEFDPALADYDRALELDPLSVDTHLARARLFQDQNRLEDARAAYQEAIAVDPSSAEAHHGLGEIALRQGKLDEAVAAAEMALEIDSDFRRAHYVRGQALLRLGRTDEGQSELRRFQEAEARARVEEQRLRDMQAMNRQAIAHLARGENREAIRQLEDAIELFPREPLLYSNLAAAQSQSRLHRDAANTFLTMIDLGIGDALTHLRLAWEYELIGDPESSELHREIYARQREEEQRSEAP